MGRTWTSVVSSFALAAALGAASFLSVSTAHAERGFGAGQHGLAKSGWVKLTQGRGKYPSGGDGGSGNRGGGRGPGFGGGGFGIVIPLPGPGGGGNYDRPPRRQVEDDDDKPRKPPKKKSAGKSGGSPPTIVARPQPRPAGTPPAPIGPLNGERRDREVLVTLADATPDNVVTGLGRAYRLNQQSNFQSATLGVRLARFRIPDNRGLNDVMNQLAGDARVLAVQPVYIYLFSQGAAGSAIAAPPQYAADKVRLAEAHRLARGRNVPIVIIDTGVDATHPELKGATIQSFDAVGSGKAVAEPHGTAIAGIVGAREQLTGIAPDARIVAVRAFAQAAGGRFEGTTETLIKGIDMGLRNGGRLFNLSFTGPRDPSVEQIIRIAEGKGAVFIAAAGNGGPSAPAAFPAAYDTVVAVTAVDSRDKLYERANRGSYIALAAPGVDILAPAPKRGYELSSGTSLAAAHVSGIVALMMERKPGLRSADIRRLLADSARRGEQTWAQQDFGAGVVDAARALEALN
jgi:hypothetical protein